MKEKSKLLSIESLELQTSYHCNLSCKGCSHCSPLENESFFDVDKEIENLKLLTNVLHIKIVKLIGGEPLLNKNIVYIIKKLKENKIADEVWVATNGILLIYARSERNGGRRYRRFVYRYRFAKCSRDASRAGKSDSYHEIL